MFFVIFFYCQIWVLADVIANFYFYFCQMLIQHLTKDVAFCDRCYVTVVMAFIVADVVPLW